MIDDTLDYHAHILPGCDHGSDGIATSLQQIKIAKAAGIKNICATPHFYPHRESIESFLCRRQESFEKLCDCLKEDNPRIIPGAEVLLCEGMERLRDLDKLCLQGTNELLLELPFYRWTEQIWETLYQLHEIEEIEIIIAHADRYPQDDIERIIREGMSLQLNIACFRKLWQRKSYLSWIEKGKVIYVGSDIHMLGREYRDWEKYRKLLNRCSY